jgi:hypothetical protein
VGCRSHTPDPQSRRQVETLAGFGIPEPDIAGVLGIDPKTLRKHYRHELDHGHVKANAKVAENLYRKATGDGRESVIAAIFWLKTRAGWKETVINQVEVEPRDSVKLLLQQISESGRRIHDRNPPTIDMRPVTRTAEPEAPTGLSSPLVLVRS